MHARMLPILFTGLLLVTAAYVAGALDLPTVSPRSDDLAVSRVDEPQSEHSAILTPPVRLDQGSARVAIRDDRTLRTAWALVAVFYPLAFGLMANCGRIRSFDWFHDSLVVAWTYAVGAIVAFPVIRFLIGADQNVTLIAPRR